MQHILILGAGYGGLLTALRLQPQIKKGNARVTLFNGSDTFVERIRLHQTAVGQSRKLINIPDFLRGTGIEFIQDFVRHIDPDENRVTLDHQVLDYDMLAIALGSRVNRDVITGIRDHAYTLDPASTQALRQQLENGGKLLIIGGGLTGIEAATEFGERKDVTVQLVTHDVVGNGLSAKGRQHIHKTLTRLGVTVHEHVNVDEIHATYADSTQGKLDFDAVLWAGGFEASPIVSESGFATNEYGQMLVRETMQSLAYDNVYGVGDIAQVVMPDGKQLRMACAVAMPMGAHVADNIRKQINQQTPDPFRFAYAMQCISLGRRDGLIQFVQGDDEPKDNILTGRLGAFVKEMICRYTTFSLKLEKRMPGSYWYPKRTFADSEQPMESLAKNVS